MKSKTNQAKNKLIKPENNQTQQTSEVIIFAPEP